jgi:hypothetical protein
MAHPSLIHSSVILSKKLYMYVSYCRDRVISLYSSKFLLIRKRYYVLFLISVFIVQVTKLVQFTQYKTFSKIPPSVNFATRVRTCRVARLSASWRSFLRAITSIMRRAVRFVYPLLFKTLYSSSWDGTVLIATGYGLDDRGVGVRVPVGSRIFSSPRRSDRLWGPPSLLSNGYRGTFPAGKAAGREADHSPPTSAEVKETWVYTSTPPFVFMA